MLGWMLKRGENAPDADAEDTTQLDQPDTPAPVFAARALKSALFGTPAPASDETRNQQNNRVSKRTASKAENASGTPSKLPGILLTPGTGTSRRKRVSFGYDVVGAAAKPGTGNDTAAARAGDGSRHQSANEQEEESGKGALANDSEGEWEEADDDEFGHDITLDLNEPHSQSGRFWKGEFEKYHQEAKAEMEKLLKYKQLAKSYARQKDSEAIHLAERLRDEQQKVIKMEKRIAENASHIVSRHRESSDTEHAELLAKLTRQTALAAQYRHRVQELENDLGDLMRQKEGASEGASRRRRTAAPASPMTQKTLLDTQRELRRARSQLRELDSLREEVSSLKARLKVAESQASRHAKEDTSSTEGNRARTLRTQLEQARGECATKDEELRQLKSDFEEFRKESETHEADTKAVLERAHAKISDLKKELKMLKAAGSDQQRPGGSGAEHEPAHGTVAARSAKRHEVAGRVSRSTDGDWRRHVAPDVDEQALSSTMARAQPRDEADSAAKPAAVALTERTNLGKPRWQPFVPRSPRNRAYLDNDAARRVREGAGPEDTAAPSLPVSAGPTADDEAQIDILRRIASRSGKADNKTRSSGPPPEDTAAPSLPVSTGPVSTNEQAQIDILRRIVSRSGQTGNKTRSSKLPPERRAAALARIEKRLAEKKRAPRRQGHDKENMRP
ncbi:hypothetical protein CDD83_3523 [Cordyceps sp. RAO-2017]|nr:hypothetical protein CDD83_3523 [Cordyceps sp. RAO-2017]